jgi:hypothetical protein
VDQDRAYRASIPVVRQSDGRTLHLVATVDATGVELAVVDAEQAPVMAAPTPPVNPHRDDE